MFKGNNEAFCDDDSEMEERISRLLINLGITARLKGYGYLITGIQMAIKEPERVTSITKELYPIIAQKHKTSPDKVERGIRHAVQNSRLLGRVHEFNRLLGCEAYKEGDRITNSQFIALSADGLRYKRKEK